MARWGMMRNMSKNGSTGSRRKAVPASGVKTGQTLDLERYVPAFVTFIANKLSRSATAFYQRRFGVNVTEWRMMSLLAIEPGITASRICYVIGFDKGDRKSTRLNSSHQIISYAVFCLKKKKEILHPVNRSMNRTEYPSNDEPSDNCQRNSNVLITSTRVNPDPDVDDQRITSQSLLRNC